MPPLPGLEPVVSPSMVPVIRRPPGNLVKGKAPIRGPPRRQYNDEPLPFKPASSAPKNARIVGRLQAHDGALVSYQLKIGDVEINEVTADEILDYVSALELEQFEHVKFREEAEILKVLETDREIERRAKLEKAAERARTKGAVFFQDESESDVGLAFDASTDGADVAIGKHGRARPDYSKFYKKPRGKGKKVFDEFGDDAMVDDLIQTDHHEPGNLHHGSSPANGPLSEPPKRRRRKRDPVTGELMPLAPLPQSKLGTDKKVRRRRKRHPHTGELMPLGWRHDPEAEGDAYGIRREGPEPIMKAGSLERLSISGQPDAKRQRLDTESVDSSSMSPVPTKAEIMGQASSQYQSTPKNDSKVQKAVVDLLSSESESEANAALGGSTTKRRSKVAGNSMLRATVGSTATTTADESSPEPAPLTSISRPSARSPPASQRTSKLQQAKTSILSPSAARANSTDPLGVQSDDDMSDDDDDIEEGEWFIESILGHRMSDPSTHPPELGKTAVMLYKVKWVGYDDPTWEPIESFGDRSFVDGYRKKVGLNALPPGNTNNDDQEGIAVVPAKSTPQPIKSSKLNGNAMDEDDEGQEYEVERIVAHHLSDPRTHPAQLGKTPVMLYQVKWKGFDELTWEPEKSFDSDADALKVYKRRKGLK